MRGTPKYLLLAIGVAPCVVVALGALLVVPQFNIVFVNFGTSLPLATRILLATFQCWGIAPFLTVGPWLFWPNAANRDAVAIIFGAISSAALFVFGVYACYAPILVLAAYTR